MTRYGGLGSGMLNASGPISMAIGTTQQFLFPLVYDDPSQGSFDAVLTGADFFVGANATIPEAGAIIHLTLSSGLSVQTINSVRYLVASLAPTDTASIAPAIYAYAAAIAWGTSDRAVIGQDAFNLGTWPGHPAPTA